MATKYSGVSAFAMMNANYPFEALLATLDFAPNPAFAALWGTFADSTPFSTARFKQFTDRYHYKPHMIEIHPINNTAIRNKKQFEGEPFPQYDIAKFNAALERNDPATLATIAARIREIKTVLDEVKNENTYLVLTTGLEDDYTDKAFVNIHAEMAKHWPYFIIRCGRSYGSFPREVHGASAQVGGSAIFANEDGSIQTLSQTKVWMAKNDGAMCKLIWRAQHQGRSPVTNDFPSGSPRDRVFTYPASDVDTLGPILGPYPAPGPGPTPEPDRWVCPVPHVLKSTLPPGEGYDCPGAVPPPNPNPNPPGTGIGGVCPNIIPCANGILWKPESQDSGGTREGKPVILFANAKYENSLKIYASNGAQIGSVGYYGTHNGAGSRYYSGWAGGSMETAAQLQAEAIAAAGSPNIYVRITTGCVGPIVPTQRTGNI